MLFDDFFFYQYGTSALMVASYTGHYDCVKELIMQGADINLQREVRQLSMLGRDLKLCKTTVVK